MLMLELWSGFCGYQGGGAAGQHHEEVMEDQEHLVPQVTPHRQPHPLHVTFDLEPVSVAEEHGVYVEHKVGRPEENVDLRQPVSGEREERGRIISLANGKAQTKFD